jgi:hypothetical protein
MLHNILRAFLRLLRDKSGDMGVPSFKKNPELKIITVPANFTPTPKQIDTLARRMMPEIKKFFAEEQNQREFAEWQAKQVAK